MSRPHRSNRTYSKTATTPARFLGRRPRVFMRMTPNCCCTVLGSAPGFRADPTTPNRREAPFMVRRLPLDVGLRREPLVQASQDVSRCLCGLTCTRPAQISCCRGCPRAARYTPPDTPLVGQFVRAMRCLQADQNRLTSVEEIRERRGATAEHKARSTAILGVVCEQSCARSESSATAPAT